MKQPDIELLDRVRRVAAQTDHQGEREAALAQAVRLRGSNFIYERALADIGRRILAFERMARDFPAMKDGLRELADRQRECRRETMMLNNEAPPIQTPAI